jgi:DNA (cytosine-5)-methyltransferase 1
MSDVPKPLTTIDLFAGCGGMTAGFVRHGFEPVLAVEWNLHAAATYAANFGEDHIIWGDITQLADSAIPEVDVVIGGPPCQGFSTWVVGMSTTRVTNSGNSTSASYSTPARWFS